MNFSPRRLSGDLYTGLEPYKSLPKSQPTVGLDSSPAEYFDKIYIEIMDTQHSENSRRLRKQTTNYKLNIKDNIN